MLRIYLIGAGAISRHHAHAISKLPDFRRIVLSVTDVSETTINDFLKEFPEANVFRSVDEMLAEPARDNDIVVVATPPASHCELSCRALSSGRNVLCEKPLAMNADEAERMLETARKHKRLIGCCSDRFFGMATTDKVKELIANGDIGDIYHVRFIHRSNRSRSGVEHQPSSRWFLDRSKSGGGVLMDWGPYDFSMLNDVLDPLRTHIVDAWTAQPEAGINLEPGTVNDVEQHVGAIMVYELRNGKKVRVTYERAACTHGEELSVAEIEGTHGSVQWEWIKWDGNGTLKFNYDRDGERVSDVLPMHQDGQLIIMEKPLVYFASKVSGLDSPALVDEQAVFNFKCLRAVYDCADQGVPQTVERREMR